MTVENAVDVSNKITALVFDDRLFVADGLLKKLEAFIAANPERKVSRILKRELEEKNADKFKQLRERIKELRKTLDDFGSVRARTATFLLIKNRVLWSLAVMNINIT